MNSYEQNAFGCFPDDCEKYFYLCRANGLESKRFGWAYFCSGGGIFPEYCFVFLLILPLIFKQGYQPALNSLKTKNLNKHILRTIFSLGISYFLFSAVKFIPLVDAALLVNTAPLMMPFLGLIFLSQKINHRLWLPLIIGFIGVVLVLHPNGEVFQTASLLALAAGVCMAASIMLVRQTSQTDSALTNAFYYFLILSSHLPQLRLFYSGRLFPYHKMLILAGIVFLFFSCKSV